MVSLLFGTAMIDMMTMQYLSNTNQIKSNLLKAK